MTTNTLSIYGCGGTGSNLVQRYADVPNDPSQPYFAKTTLNTLDTSTSNANDTDKKINAFLVPGMEGAGKNRRVAFEGAGPFIVDMLNKHKPGAFNIVIFSTSGGSGSVIGPMVACELLKRGCPTVCIVIGSTTSSVEADGSLKTLTTLQLNIKNGGTGKRPIPMVYLENNNGGEQQLDYMAPRNEVDLRVAEIVIQFGMLFSGAHRELDRMDLINWLDYTKLLPDIAPQLVEVLIFKEQDGQSPGLEAMKGNAIGCASLLCSDMDLLPNLNLPYSCAGYYPPTLVENTDVPNHHFILTKARIQRIFSGLREAVEGHSDVISSLRESEVVGASEFDIGVTDQTDDGEFTMVF